MRDCLDCMNFAFKTELAYCISGSAEDCYDIRFCINVIQCKWMEYSAHCFQCEHCFGCCGLVGKKYHIFNKPVAPELFEERKNEIISTMKQTGEYGRFFPGSFAASPYQESLSGFHWPLDQATAERYGLWFSTEERERPAGASEPSEIPDRTDDLSDDLPKRTFWDATAKRPFRIEPADIAFAKDLGTPLPSTYYMRRIQENFRRIPFDGILKSSTCGQCKTNIQTSWPEEYDGRILCEECYLQEVY